MILIVEPLIPALRRYARALLRDRSAADDLVQDCLERALSRWSQRRADGDARAWMFAILHNLAMSHLRRQARRGPHLAIEAAAPALPFAPANQEDGLRQQDIVRALDRLPDDQRNVVLLISLEGLSYGEAADVLGVPVGTVMSRLSRGRERLRGLLESGDGPGAEPVLGRIS